ncbi:MAG: tetratricopeptide repeat protein, partial [Muribaculaceae bacterium]
EDPTYIGYVINYYLQNKQFEQAFAMVDEAIASDPNNAQYYFIKGILYDNQDKKAEAKAEFRKAIDMDPENWQALLQYGRVLCEEAYALSDAAPTTADEYEAYFNEKIVPLFKEAADYLEKSWNINSENPEALRYLENIYYNLHDDAMMQDVENRKNNL